MRDTSNSFGAQRFNDERAAKIDEQGSVMLDGVSFNVQEAGLTSFVHLASVASTMDHAHALAASGAASGTLVVADVQTSGRGRGGKTWVSEAGQGLWCTLIERAPLPEALSVLSLRVGLAAAEVAAPWCEREVQLKWPNDVLLRDGTGLGKLCGVLVEARWRETTVEWVAVGIGVNLRQPSRAVPGGFANSFPPAALSAEVSRAEFLTALMPRVRAAAQMPGELTEHELQSWSSRDAMRGQSCVQPEAGVVDGIHRDGSLRVITADGSVTMHRSGSLILSGESVTC